MSRPRRGAPGAAGPTPRPIPGHGIAAGLALALGTLLSASPAGAHPLEFGVLTVEAEDTETYDLSLRFSGGEDDPTGAAPALEPPCALTDVVSVPLVNGLNLRGTLRCPGGLPGRRIGVRGLEGTDVTVQLRVRTPDGTRQLHLLDGAHPTARVEASVSPLDAARRYVALGVEHILLGVDHLLLVLGLLLAVPSWRRLLLVITGFTVGHSVTLAAAALEVATLPGPPVEACIALSLLVLAGSLARPNPAHDTTPVSLAVAFGLLHGFGFAGALAEVGLPLGARVPALVAFNVGVELGQLAFVAACLAVGALAARVVSHERRALVRRGVVTALGGVAAYFLFDRLAALGT